MNSKEKIFIAHIKRKPGYIYTLEYSTGRVLAISCVPIHPNQVKNPKARLVVQTDLIADPDYIYFLDSDGDISRTKIIKGL